jgi:hypothetical protein
MFSRMMNIMLGQRVASIAGMVACKEKIDFAIAKVKAHGAYFHSVNEEGQDPKVKEKRTRLVKIVYNIITTAEDNYKLCCNDGFPLKVVKGNVGNMVVDATANADVSVFVTKDNNFREHLVRYIDCSSCTDDKDKAHCHDFNNKEIDNLYNMLNKVRTKTHNMNTLNDLMKRYSKAYMLNSKAPENSIIKTKIYSMLKNVNQWNDNAKNQTDDNIENQMDDPLKIQEHHYNTYRNKMEEYKHKLLELTKEDTLKTQVLPIIDVIDTTIAEYMKEYSNFTVALPTYNQLSDVVVPTGHSLVDSSSGSSSAGVRASEIK